MKQVSITVVKDGIIQTISMSFDTRNMPEQLDAFIKEHIGGRPNDRK
tara:strand:+ start:2495 stop:2635 length:141 start_codon:yes stop_codon:yes gene_type:complete